MSSAHPGWRFEVAPDTGHVPMLEAPGWTSEVIEDWLGHEGSAAAATGLGGRARTQLTWRSRPSQ